MITLHHLRIGRSLFTAFLLEELGVPYDLKVYDRNTLGRAPEELKHVHPLGKSPVIEDDGVTIAESGAIAWHLVERYDTEQRFAPPPMSEKAARAEWFQWFHYTEASAFAPLLLKLLLARESDPKPAIVAGFASIEVPLQLTYIADFLADKDYLLGDTMQLPDFGMGFIVQLADRIGELNDYPTLQSYLTRLESRPAYATALAKTGG
ncbi:MAG: glutathione S-transferase [Pseudomonadota bacterium]